MIASTGYKSISAALLAEIRDGKYRPEHPFPSLTSIMRRFGVTRITAKRAVDDLKRCGAVRVEPRRPARRRHRPNAEVQRSGRCGDRQL